jgi:hypothetical protein
MSWGKGVKTSSGCCVCGGRVVKCLCPDSEDWVERDFVRRFGSCPECSEDTRRCECPRPVQEAAWRSLIVEVPGECALCLRQVSRPVGRPRKGSDGRNCDVSWPVLVKDDSGIIVCRLCYCALVTARIDLYTRARPPQLEDGDERGKKARKIVKKAANSAANELHRSARP